MAAWHNDLFSLGKELAYGDVHNLFLVLARERALELEAGKRLVAVHCNKEVATFETLRAELPAFGVELDTELRAYVDALSAMMPGNLDWSLDTARYKRHRSVTSEAYAAT